MSKKVTKGILAVVFMAMCLIAVQPQKTQAAQEIPISSADDLRQMENNPSGSYYLTKDITVPANTVLFKTYEVQFTGTLDGKGHAINGYTYSDDKWADSASLFSYATNATFKNLKMSNVNISLRGGGNACALVSSPTKCTFENITTSGKITVGGTASNAAGITVMPNEKCTFIKCVNNADITVNAYDITKSAEQDNIDSASGVACGIAGFASDGTAKQCSNSGKITINGDLRWGSEGITAVGLFEGIKSITASKNTGTVTAKNVSGAGYANGTVLACGVAGQITKMASCYNTASISASNNNKQVGVIAVGITNSASGAKTNVFRCYNKGAVQISGVAGSKAKSRIISGAGGVGGLDIYSVTESYNTGKVTANVSSGNVMVGGVVASVVNVRNCYNTGKISASASARGYIGGIAGEQSSPAKGKSSDAAACNYNTATVKEGSKISKGSILGRYEISGIYAKAAVYDNYYKSGKPYGSMNITWKPFFAKAVKTSSMKPNKCKKLSSKYWVYSSKHKRMVLKKNKEK